MDFMQAMGFLRSLPRLAEKPGLARMRQLLAALGDPQRRLRFVHIAGTNGKGSTTVMLASILAKAGYKVGANISPYVMDFEERFQINGQNAERQALADVFTEVQQAACTLDEMPLEFEAVTAAAFLYFARQGCDFVCLEAGIGGRRDHTNVIENTLVACITKIGLDHQALLGQTLTEIAREKCGIFKNHCSVVSYPEQPADAAKVICRVAQEKGCPLVVPELGLLQRSGIADAGNPFAQKASYKGLPFTIQLPGRHQALNATVAIEAAFALRQQGYAISEEAITVGLGAAHLAARIEVVQAAPLILVDGAHNEDAAKALADTLAAAHLSHFAGVAGFLRDKPFDGILRILSPFLDVLYAATPDSSRALPARQTAEITRRYVRQVETFDDTAGALRAAEQAFASGVLVFGSFYLAGEVKRLLR